MKSSDLPDSDVLDLIRSGSFPFDALCPPWPKPLVAQKLRKLQGRGWVTVSGSRYALTAKGREALAG